MSRTPHVCQDDRVVNGRTSQCPEGSLQLQCVLETVLGKKQSQTARVLADLEPCPCADLDPQSPHFLQDTWSCLGWHLATLSGVLGFSGPTTQLTETTSGRRVLGQCASPLPAGGGRRLNFHCVLANSGTCACLGARCPPSRGARLAPALRALQVALCVPAVCSISGKQAAPIGQSPPQRQRSDSVFLNRSSYQHSVGFT